MPTKLNCSRPDQVGRPHGAATGRVGCMCVSPTRELAEWTHHGGGTSFTLSQPVRDSARRFPRKTRQPISGMLRKGSSIVVGAMAQSWPGYAVGEPLEVFIHKT